MPETWHGLSEEQFCRACWTVGVLGAFSLIGWIAWLIYSYNVKEDKK